MPPIVAVLTVLPVRSCLIDGEAVVCNESGLAVFDLIRGYRHDAAAVLCAFDLLTRWRVDDADDHGRDSGYEGPLLNFDTKALRSEEVSHEVFEYHSILPAEWPRTDR